MTALWRRSFRLPIRRDRVMTLALSLFETPGSFAERAMTFLLQHEAENCLLIGIVAQAIENVRRWDGPVTFATVEDGSTPVAATVRTPPYDPVLSRMGNLAAVTLLVGHYMEQDVAGVMAPIDIGALFAAEWSRRTGQSTRLSMPERIYKIENVKLVDGVPGTLRRASMDDRELLIRWSQAFVAEAFGDRAVPEQAERGVDTRLSSGQSGFAFWEDGRPVCMVGYSGPTPDGIRIGPVYTPREFRRRGYGSAATAALSKRLIEEGRKFCVLFADLDNPTSNHIYQEIGYEPVADIGVYRFTP